MNHKEILEKDNCQSVSSDGKEVCIKVVRLRTETFYKAGAMCRGGLSQDEGPNLHAANRIALRLVRLFS